MYAKRIKDELANDLIKKVSLFCDILLFDNIHWHFFGTAIIRYPISNISETILSFLCPSYCNKMI